MKENVIIQTSESSNEVHWINKDKTEEINKAGYGTLVAFYDSNGKPRTGAILEVDKTNKIVTITTEYLWQFEVPYSEVLWVKNGNRWPKGVYNILKKGKNKNGKIEKSNNKKDRSGDTGYCKNKE